MKCISKPCSFFVIMLMLSSVYLSGCSSIPYEAKYSIDKATSSNRCEPFAADKCVADVEDITSQDMQVNDKVSAGLFDINRRRTLYAKNVHERLKPASLTKVMTAYIALKYYGDQLDKVLVADSSVYANESGAQALGLKEGCSMTLNEALHALLIYSANDVANLIATNLAGSIEGFADMMNAEAMKLGATQSNFKNPNGLNVEDHLVTAYDMYLIFSAAMKFDTFSEIISMNSYDVKWTDENGEGQSRTIDNTNGYLRGDVAAPSGVTVIGGKTGTTNAAGHCLILLAKDGDGNPYIAVIMRDTDGDTLYSDMTNMLNEIVK